MGYRVGPATKQLEVAALLKALHHRRTGVCPKRTLGSPANDSDFIRTSCGTTLFPQVPQVCYTSLSRYASAIQNNPVQLAKVAIGVSLAKARRMAAYVSDISRQADYGADPRSAAALHSDRRFLDAETTWELGTGLQNSGELDLAHRLVSTQGSLAQKRRTILT